MNVPPSALGPLTLPDVSSPQHSSVPSVLIAHVCPLPALTFARTSPWAAADAGADSSTATIPAAGTSHRRTPITTSVCKSP